MNSIPDYPEDLTQEQRKAFADVTVKRLAEEHVRETGGDPEKLTVKEFDRLQVEVKLELLRHWRHQRAEKRTDSVLERLAMIEERLAGMEISGEAGGASNEAR